MARSNFHQLWDAADRFENVRAYVDYMTPRLKELYRVLKPTGNFYYHCDWHASHYIKVLLDRDDLFSYANFQNEIVWAYKRYTGVSTKFQRVHEIILFYAKSRKKTFNLIHDEYVSKTTIFDPPLTTYFDPPG